MHGKPKRCKSCTERRIREPKRSCSRSERCNNAPCAQCKERIVVENCLSVQKQCDGRTEVLFNSDGTTAKFVLLQVQNTGDCTVALAVIPVLREQSNNLRMSQSHSDALKKRIRRHREGKHKRNVKEQRQRRAQRCSRKCVKQQKPKPRFLAVVRPGGVVVLTLTNVEKIVYKCCCRQRTCARENNLQERRRSCSFCATIKAEFCEQPCANVCGAGKMSFALRPPL